MTLKQENGQYIIQTPQGDTVRVYRLAYALKLLAKLGAFRGKTARA